MFGKILNFLGGLIDTVKVRDELLITLRKDDKVIKQWKVKGHTWTTAGLNAIRNALTDGGFSKISYMSAFTTSDNEAAVTPSKPADKQAKFTATWGSSGDISGITEFRLRQTSGGTNMATVSVSSFDKPDGVSLEVQWTTTLSS